MKLFEEFENSYENWLELVECYKNPYQFGDEIDMDSFKEALRQAYDYLSEIKSDITANECDKDDVFNYVQLISVISQYVADTYIEDESENHLFTVTRLLADALVQFAGSDYTDSLEIITDGEPLTYDFETEDLSEIIKWVNSNYEDYE